MADGLRRLLLSALLGACTQSALAAEPEPDTSTGAPEQVIEPQIERSDVIIPKIDTEDFEVGAYVGVMSVEDFESNLVYGLRLAFHVSEDFFVEGVYGWTETGRSSIEGPFGGATLMSDEDRQMTYYNASIGWNILPGEAFVGRGRAFSSALYLIGGIGTTTWAGEDWFTGNWGFGYRLLLTDWLAMHLDARDHMFEHDVLGESKRVNNLELTTSVTVFF